MSSTKFDLSLLDYESRRHAKRKKLLIRSILPVIIAISIGLWLTAPYVFTAQAIDQYSRGNNDAAQSWVQPLLITSPDRFVALFDNGTNNIQLKNYTLAEEQLGQALTIAPEYALCMTAQNLAYSLMKHKEARADDAQAVATLDARMNDVGEKFPQCFSGAASQGGGSGSSSSSDSDSLSDDQQDQLEQKEQEGRERQAQFARDETFNPDDPNVKRW